MDLTKKRISKIMTNKKQSRRKFKERKHKKNRYSVGNRKKIHLKNKSLKFRKGGKKIVDIPETIQEGNEGENTQDNQETERVEAREEQPSNVVNNPTPSKIVDIMKLKKKVKDIDDSLVIIKQTKQATETEIPMLEEELAQLNEDLKEATERNASRAEIDSINSSIRNKNLELEIAKSKITNFNKNLTENESKLGEAKAELVSMGVEPSIVDSMIKSTSVPEEMASVQGQEISPRVAPVEEAVAPVEEAVAPVEEVVAPVEEAVVPVEEAVVPVEEVVAPVEEAVVPVEEAVAPVEEVVAPVEEKETPNKEPTEKLEDVYTTMTTEEDEAYKTIKVIVKIPKNANVNLIDKTSETAMSQLQKTAGWQ